jgi:hypothetical protein
MTAAAIVFRTTPDGTLARACDGNVVAFEVDAVGQDGRSGWSVLVVGVASLITGSEALRALELKLVSAAGADLDQFVAIPIGRLTGRRIGDTESQARGAYPSDSSTFSIRSLPSWDGCV